MTTYASLFNIAHDFKTLCEEGTEDYNAVVQFYDSGTYDLISGDDKEDAIFNYNTDRSHDMFLDCDYKRWAFLIVCEYKR